MFASALFFAGCAQAGSPSLPTDLAGLLRTSTARPEPPQDYAVKKNPFTGKSQQAGQGQELYEADCASCHGLSARGDGPVAASLSPKPGNLAEDQSELSDAYLYWRIAEGGLIEPFRSGMPAWRGLLTEEQIWEVITYIRSIGTSDQSGSGP